MPEYVQALDRLAVSQEHISGAVAGLSEALLRSTEDQETRSRQRFTLVYRILAVMIAFGVVFALVFLVRQQTQIDTLHTIVNNSQTQLENQRKGLASRDAQFDLARRSDVCAQRLQAGFLGSVGTTFTLPGGTPERERAVAEFLRITALIQHVDQLCYGPNPSADPIHAAVPS